MIRIRVHPLISLAVAAIVLVSMLVGRLTGGPGDTAPTVPNIVIPTRPPVPGQPVADGVTVVDGESRGDLHQVLVDAGATAQEGDVTLVYIGGTDTDRGVRATVQVASPTDPSGELLLYAGDRFESGGFVFEVNEQTNVLRLVLDVWTPA